MSEAINAALVRRLGIVMEPDLADPREAAGVLNPAIARDPDGHLYLLPRLVAAGSYSRIGLARVTCAPCGTPTGVQRLGVVLTPQAPYELNTRSGGGVEDPHVTYLAARGWYVMLYTAWGPAARASPPRSRAILCTGAARGSCSSPSCTAWTSPRWITKVEREGMVPGVIFPTGVDARPDGALDVYYGMADSRIGVARFRCDAGAALAPAQAA